MSEDNKTVKANNASQAKTNQIWAKYMAFCGKVYDFFAMICRGQRKHTQETLKVSQKRGTWIVTAFIVLAGIGAFTDDEEETTADASATSEVVSDDNDSDSNSGKNATTKQKPRQSIGKPKTFTKVHRGVMGIFDLDAEPGIAQSCDKFLGSLKILSVDDDGVIVIRNEKVAFIKTSRSGYVDGDYVRSGAYVRKGTYRYTSADGARRTIPAFEEITNARELEIFNALLDLEKAKEEAEKSQSENQ